MTLTEKAKQLRGELKEIGYNSKQISVRSKDGLSITIKDFSIKFREIAPLVRKYEHIRRDQITGEILCGGNTFVSIGYDYGELRKASSRYQNFSIELFNKCEALPVGSGEIVYEIGNKTILYFPHELYGLGSIRILEDGNTVKAYVAHNVPHMQEAFALIEAEFDIGVLQ